MNITANPNELLNEFDLINQLIAKSRIRDWSNSSLTQTLVGISDGIYNALDILTQPRKKTFRERLVEKKSVRIERPQAMLRETTKIGFEYRGEFNPCTSRLNIHRKLLLRLLKEFPEKWEAIAASVKRLGYNRSYISNEREKLFYKKDPRWVRKYSRPLLDGWYIDINVTPERIRKILPVAVWAAGLKWGSDVRVIWE